MPEVTQYTVSHREVLELIVKNLNIHEGKWMLVVNFGFTAANIGSGPEDALPTALVQVQKLVIQQATPDAPSALVVDAAEVNPDPKGTKSVAKRKS
ncbi:MAG: hypothetical protein H7124_02415 [Phycisphaerales bacterium]|nr:hypothetical protein [Hyphomonadaceae bacterium]